MKSAPDPQKAGRDLHRYRGRIAAFKRNARIVREMLEVGDNRIIASSDGGPVNGQLPQLSPEEWGIVYRACKRIAELGE